MALWKRGGAIADTCRRVRDHLKCGDAGEQRVRVGGSDVGNEARVRHKPERLACGKGRVEGPTHPRRGRGIHISPQ